MKGKALWQVVLLVGVCLMAAGFASAAGKLRVGVVTIVSHPALDADQKGFEDALKEAGFAEGKNVSYDRQNAQGDMTNAQTIARKFVDEKVDLIHAIATPTAQAAVKAAGTIPVVYSSVTDPVDARLVPTMGPSGTNVTGVSDAWPIEDQIKTYIQIVPKAETWGTVYNAGDANSLINVDLTRKALEKAGKKLVEVTISSTSELHQAAQSLVGKVGAVYITSDNAAVSGFEAIAKVCNQNRIPLFAGDVDSVPRGAIAALGFNYYDVGYAAGKKAALILKGQKPGEIPSGYAEKLTLHISLPNALAQGVTVPEEIVKQAGKVYR